MKDLQKECTVQRYELLDDDFTAESKEYKDSWLHNFNKKIGSKHRAGGNWPSLNIPYSQLTGYSQLTD